jgi:hypothetical protein
MEEPVIITAAVEGIVDEAVARKIIVHAGGLPGTVYGKNGKPHLQRQIKGYNNAARHAPWMILVDLDHDAECAPPLCKDWLPDKTPFLCFRVAIRKVEAWLMADAESLAGFLGLPRNKIPPQPETIDDPKTMMVNLARLSRRREIQADMVPRAESGRVVGPAYTSRMIEFVQTRWNPEVAAKRADSLRRAMACIGRLVKETDQ